MAIDFPVRPFEATIVRLAPVPNSFVRGAEATIGTQMGRPRNHASRCGRAHDRVALNERTVELNTHLEPNSPVPIDRDVPTRLHLLGAHRLPHAAAPLRYD